MFGGRSRIAAGSRCVPQRRPERWQMRRGAERWGFVPGWAVVGVLTGCIALAGCGSAAISQAGPRETTCGGTPSGVSYITAWFHASASVDAEWQTMVRQVAEFNRSQRHVRVKLITLPEGDYDQQVASAAATGNLPDVLDFDGPNLYNYAWAGDLKPLDSCLTARQRADLLPSIRQQGTYDGQMWGVGTFDSGLGLYVRKSILRRAGSPFRPAPPKHGPPPSSLGSSRACGRWATASPSTFRSTTTGSARVVHVRLRARGLVSRGRSDRPSGLPPG